MPATATTAASNARLEQAQWLAGNGREGLVSYVVPAYNAGPYIQDTLDSCLLQDYRPLQVVVVDDGSTDDTAVIVRDFQVRNGADDFEVLLISQENAGLNAARNAGLRAATGDVLGFLDADDMLPATRTSHLRQHMQRLHADLVYGPCVRFRERSEVETYLDATNDAASTDTVKRAPCVPVGKWVPNVWSFLARREFLAGIGPLTEHHRSCWVDLDYTIRIRHRAPQMYSTTRVVNLYRRVPGSLADRSSAQSIRGTIRVIEDMNQFFLDNDVVEPDSWEWLARMYWRAALGLTWKLLSLGIGFCCIGLLFLFGKESLDGHSRVFPI